MVVRKYAIAWSELVSAIEWIREAVVSATSTQPIVRTVWPRK